MIESEAADAPRLGDRVVPVAAWLVERQSSFLAEASKQLASSLDYEATLRAVAQLAVPAVADWCAVDILDDDGTLHRLAVAYADPALEALVAETASRYAPSPTARVGVPRVLRTGQSALLADLSLEIGTDEDDIALLRKLGMGSAIIVPLLARGRTLGALTFATTGLQHQYAHADLVLAEELASRCALAVDNARLYREAREALELRDTFLAAVSHDLRNPLATISGQAQLLRRLVARQHPAPVERVNEGLLRIEGTVTRLSSMIDELLDVARLQLGQPLELQPQPFDLVSLARRKVAEYQQTTQRHILRLAAETALPGTWDPDRLERVIDNLLGNAIKYSPEGGVITVIVVDDQDDTGEWTVLEVRDPGVGIPASDLPRIFEHFSRARNVGQIDGTGIGLAVSRQIVVQHGGSISVDSTEGMGSVFTVRLPRHPSGLPTL
jgi:signal transduction histidine kinase